MAGHLGVTIRIELGLITFREVVDGPFFGEDIMSSALPFANDNKACIGVSVDPVETCLSSSGSRLAGPGPQNSWA